jgi:hypothetical protein
MIHRDPAGRLRVAERRREGYLLEQVDQGCAVVDFTSTHGWLCQTEPLSPFFAVVCGMFPPLLVESLTDVNIRFPLYEWYPSEE